MPGSLHQPEGLLGIGEVERTIGKWLQRALREQRGDLAEQLRGKLGALDRQLIGIDAEIADIVTKRAEADRAVLVEVALAQL